MQIKKLNEMPGQTHTNTKTQTQEVYTHIRKMCWFNKRICKRSCHYVPSFGAVKDMSQMMTKILDNGTKLLSKGAHLIWKIYECKANSYHWILPSLDMKTTFWEKAMIFLFILMISYSISKIGVYDRKIHFF